MYSYVWLPDCNEGYRTGCGREGRLWIDMIDMVDDYNSLTLDSASILTLAIVKALVSLCSIVSSVWLHWAILIKLEEIIRHNHHRPLFRSDRLSAWVSICSLITSC